MTDTGTPATMTTDQQTAALNAEVAKYAAKGWTVSNVTSAQAVLQRKKRIGWFWNIVLTVVTGGLWLIVIVVRLVNRKMETVILAVDLYGNVVARS